MSPSHRDNALAALLQPFSDGVLRWPQAGKTLFLRARDGIGMHALHGDGVACTQPFRPEALHLALAGFDPVDEEALPESGFSLVLVLPPRQREEARALLAKACAAVAPGGIVIAAVANDEGAKSREADLKQLAGGGVAALSKHHCRTFWTRPDASFDAALLAQWRQLDAPRRIASDEVPGGGFLSRPGVFAWDRVDAASAMLAAAPPADLHGRVADFGAGWGYLSMQLLARCPQVASLDLFEADARALALARRNLAAAPASGRKVPVNFHWHDVEAGETDRFDAIVCNPPFHALGRGERPDIGRAFIAAAAAALAPGGSLWLVANRHLPYEDALGAGFAQTRIVVQDGGFKIVEAVKA